MKLHSVRVNGTNRRNGVVLLPSRTRVKFMDVVELVKRCRYDKVALVNYNDSVYNTSDLLYYCETYPDELCFMKTGNFLSGRSNGVARGAPHDEGLVSAAQMWDKKICGDG